MAKDSPLRALLAEPDAHAYRWLRGALMRLDVDPIGNALNEDAILGAVASERPDMVFLSATVPGSDGVRVLKRVKALSTGAMPAVFACTLRSFGEDARVMRELGACRALWKPIGFDDLAGAIAALTPYDRLEPECASHERVGKLLSALQIPANLKGFTYLCEAVSLAVRDANLVRSLSAELYPAIGHRLGVKPILVERSIRSAIEVAWSHGQVDALYRFFGDAIDAHRGKPTNSEFIARVSQALRTGE